jgi:1,4-dihydroxy-2-naphthoyl-CoA hydrolase
MPRPTEQPFRSGFAGRIGLELQTLADDQVRAGFAVRDELKQPAGLVDGGVYATVAENICSAATWWALSEQERVTVGLSNHTSFLRPVTDGRVDAVARARHRGRTTWVWEVDFLDDRGRLCALSRVTVAVRDPREGPSAQPR